MIFTSGTTVKKVDIFPGLLGIVEITQRYQNKAMKTRARQTMLGPEFFLPE